MLFKRNILGPPADAPSSGDGATDPKYDPMTGAPIGEEPATVVGRTSPMVTRGGLTDDSALGQAIL
jgi:hypothetical protein